MNALRFMGENIQPEGNQIIKRLLLCIRAWRSHGWWYWAIANSTNTHIWVGCVTFYGPKSQYQRTSTCRCNRKISNNCPSCTACRILASVSSTKGAVITANDHPWPVAFAQWFVIQSEIDMHFACRTVMKPPFRLKECLMLTTCTCGP